MLVPVRTRATHQSIGSIWLVPSRQTDSSRHLSTRSQNTKVRHRYYDIIMLSHILSSSLPVNMCGETKEEGLETLLTNTFEDMSIDLTLSLLTWDECFLNVCTPKHNGEGDQSVYLWCFVHRRSSTATILSSRFMSLEILCTGPGAPIHTLHHSSYHDI
jgi:hypothetical protein